MTLIEMLSVVAILIVVSALMLIWPVRSYIRARAASDASQTLAQDIALLERAAKNGGADEGATLMIVSTNPLVYDCYYGRPNRIDPNSALGPAFMHRSFADVALTAGPIDVTTPLLFASNGSEQYVVAGTWVDQHQTIELTLSSSGEEASTANVGLNLFTGAISLPER